MAHETFVAQAGQFGSPERLAELVAVELAKLTYQELFNAPEHQPLKDAWQGGQFGLGYQKRIGTPVEVRLSSQEQFPDVKLRADGIEHDFECVMAVTRPLGKAYRGDSRRGTVVIPVPTNLPAFDPKPLRDVVAKKVAKFYQGIVHLLVYMNFDAENAKEADVLAAVHDGGGDRFESVWLLAYGREAGSSDPVTYLLRCAKESSALADMPGWMRVPSVGGLGL